MSVAVEVVEVVEVRVEVVETAASVATEVVEVRPVSVEVVETLGARGPAGPVGPAADMTASGQFFGAEDGGALVVSLSSRWGLDAQGGAYYDPDGATPGEDAWPSLDADGLFVLTLMAGGSA